MRARPLDRLPRVARPGVDDMHLRETQLARDVGRLNVGRVKDMLFDITCLSYPQLCITCVFPLQHMLRYVTFGAPTFTLPISLLKRDTREPAEMFADSRLDAEMTERDRCHRLSRPLTRAP